MVTETDIFSVNDIFLKLFSNSVVLYLYYFPPSTVFIRLIKFTLLNNISCFLIKWLVIVNYSKEKVRFLIKKNLEMYTVKPNKL